MHKSFKVYDKSTNAQFTDRGAFPFLEDKDGHLLLEDHVAAIGQAIWHGFKLRHIAPVTWRGVSSAVKNEFIAEMVKAHPEVGFCEHYWKINALTTAHYSSWKQSYLTDSEGIQSEAKLDNLSRKKCKSLKVKISNDDSDSSIVLSPTISGNSIDYKTSTSSPHDTTASTPSEYPASTSALDTDPSTTTNTSSSNTSISMNISNTDSPAACMSTTPGTTILNTVPDSTIPKAIPEAMAPETAAKCTARIVIKNPLAALMNSNMTLMTTLAVSTTAVSDPPTTIPSAIPASNLGSSELKPVAPSGPMIAKKMWPGNMKNGSLIGTFVHIGG
ncbi:hypothetical protein CY34DRAFT_18538 [Suillus luteus UH-Slu-Lm8-n1]|uniref:Uncharacterized protein n=1 Tax=Suillus luteus UH-Slu-Lm8-n1 TaxID=930992 RepID=A0A0D0AMD4_9AGAM|nr:hypothetical protein CY34DRAFT_18538 [Suillus luteus UH-Slu-Lm8-n1]